jgi:hypothetical protein
VYLYRVRLGACIKTVSASDAALAFELHIMIAAFIYLLAHLEYILRAGRDTATATLALYNFYNRIRLFFVLWHIYSYYDFILSLIPYPLSLIKV